MLLHKSVVYDSRVRREAAALAAAGDDVVVVELDAAATGTLDGFTRRSAAPPGWVRTRLPFQLYRLVFLAAFVWQIRAVRPDVVHAHDAAMLLPGLLGARLTGAALVYDSHELATGVPYRDGHWAAFVAWIERLAVPRAAAVITVSDGIAERLRAIYGLAHTPTVVRNVCALTEGPPDGSLRADLGIGDRPLVLHQGAAAPGRGCETLIRALAQVPDAELLFLGDGDPGFDARLAAEARELGVGGRVHFRSSVALERLLPCTAEADVGVSLLQDTCENHRLALPNKLFEYLAAGVPVVASDLPELRRVVTELEAGRTVDPSSPAEVAAALRAVLADGGARDRAARAGRLLPWAGELERLLGLYARLAPHAQRADAVLVVRNAVSHDSRVLRAAQALEHSGRRALIVGVAAAGAPPGPDRVDGCDVLRLAATPGASLRLRRRPPRVASSAEAPTPRPGGGPGLASPGRRLFRLAVTADLYRRGIAAVRHARPALIHANDHNTMWIALGARMLGGGRVVYDAHELWPDRNGRWEWRPWLLASEALFVRMADRVITASPGYSERMATRYRIPAPAVVRNVPASVAAPPPAGDGSLGPVAVYVGGLMPGRGLEQAIGALALLPDLRMRMIGPSAQHYADSLRKQAREAGVDGRLELVPAVAPGEVTAAISTAMLGLNLIQPVCESYELTLPNKVFEYLAAGVPVLTSDVPVCAAFVREHGIGEVVPARDVVMIARGIERLLDPARREELRPRLAAAHRAVNWETERGVLLAAYAGAAA